MRLDLSKLLYMDFEARSEVDIREVGAYAYAEHPSTEPLCCAWAVGLYNNCQLWLPGPNDQSYSVAAWKSWAVTPDVYFCAWNKDTEREILRHKFGLETPADKWIDPASLASAIGLPRALDEVAVAMGLKQTHDTSVMLQLARPRQPSKDNPDKFLTTSTRPDLFARLYDYCKQDVEVMREFMKRMPPYHWVMSDKERKLEILTSVMNDRGVEVDQLGIIIAKTEVARHTAKLTTEFSALTGGLKPKSVKVAALLGMKSTDKEHIRDALKKEPPGNRRRILELKKTLNTAATGKLNAFQNRTTGDGLLHGAMVYCGAGRTWRWSSMGVQLHNLLRGLGSGSVDWPAIDTSDSATETAFGALHSDILSDVYDSPIRTVASMMKGFLVGPFMMGDFSQIEPRTGAKMAGQLDLLEAFRQKKDPYIGLASRIYNRPFELVTSDQRFMGKQGVLGCGYGLGPGGFIYMLKSIYDIDVTEQEATRIVYTYRQMNPQIVMFWRNLENLVKQAVLEQWQEFHTSPHCPGIGARVFKSWLCIRLPSGRVLWYFEPSLEPGEYGLELYYWGRNPKNGGHWERVKTYGGKLTENVVQATARDIMADAMLRLEEHGFSVRMTVHDEIVCREDQESRLPEFEALMKEEPSWFRGIPLAVDCQLTRRYQK